MKLKVKVDASESCVLRVFWGVPWTAASVLLQPGATLPSGQSQPTDPHERMVTEEIQMPIPGSLLRQGSYTHAYVFFLIKITIIKTKLNNLAHFLFLKMISTLMFFKNNC